MKEKQLNKWQMFWFSGTPPEVYRLERGWRYLQFGLVKFTSWPDEGCVFQKKHYNGIWLHLYYWLPFEIQRQ